MPCYAEFVTGIIESGGGGPCGSPPSDSNSTVSPCCAAGDTCLSDGFCQYTHGGVPGGTGFYMAGCTDPSFKDPACPQQCVDQQFTDVVYNFTSGMWACCGTTQGPNGLRDCASPLGIPFPAPAPSQLKRLDFIIAPQTFIPIPAAASTATTAKPAAATNSPQAATASTTSHGLSMEATVGISIGGTALLCLLVGLLAFLCFQRRARRTKQLEYNDTRQPSYHPQPPPTWSTAVSPQAYEKHDLPGYWHRHSPSDASTYYAPMPMHPNPPPGLAPPMQPPPAHAVSELADNPRPVELSSREHDIGRGYNMF